MLKHPAWKDPGDAAPFSTADFRVNDEPFLFHVARDRLARKGSLAPDDVTLICADPDPTFAWSRPAIAHLDWDYRSIVRRIVGWVNNLSKGKADRRQTLTKIKLVEGGTMGPVLK